MQTAVLVVLLGGVLCGVHGAEDQSTPDLLSMVTMLQGQVHSSQRQIHLLQIKVQNLENRQAPQQSSPHVAFFAGFHTDSEASDHGPFEVDTTIKYNKVTTNIGNGYNAATGAFTAPVKGLYVFHFTIFTSLLNQPKTAAVLKKNTEKLAYAFDFGAADPQDSSTHVAVVTLETGDIVYVEQAAKTYFYDNRGQFNSFSGFLVSPM